MNHRSGVDRSKDGRRSRAAARHLAAAQYGVLGRDQALGCGLTRRQIETRLRSGEWRLARPRTYVVAGAPRSWRQDLMTALIWAGPEAAASHRSAAALWGLDGMGEGAIEITTCRHLRGRAVTLHRARLRRDEVRTRQRFRVTSVERTLADLGAVVSGLKLEIALDSALRMLLTTLDRLASFVAERGGPGCRGFGRLRRLVEERLVEYGMSHSALETRLRRLVLGSALPRPRFQHEI